MGQSNIDSQLDIIWQHKKRQLLNLLIKGIGNLAEELNENREEIAPKMDVKNMEKREENAEEGSFVNPAFVKE